MDQLQQPIEGLSITREGLPLPVIVPIRVGPTHKILGAISHPFFFKLLQIGLYFLIICLLVKTYYLFFQTDVYYATDSNIFIRSVDRYVRELDIAGLLGGIVGIFISLYITNEIEASNRFKESQSTYLISQIRDTVDGIWQKERHFEAVDNVSAVIDSVTRIIDKSVNDSKNLYIMSHDATFGYLLSFRVHTILEFNSVNIDTFKEMAFSEYYTKWEKFKNKSNEIDTRIHTVGKEILEKTTRKPVYGTLTQANNNPYKNYLEGIINAQKTRIIFFSHTSREKIVSCKYGTPGEEIFTNLAELKDLDNVYFVPTSVLPANPNGLDNKALLLEHLLARQTHNIEILQNTDFDVRLVHDVGFDVYLNEMPEPNDECFSLFMFADQQSIANAGRKLIAFQTRKEKYINDSFINIIEAAN